MKPLHSGHLPIADTFLGPDGVRCREVSLYSPLSVVLYRRKIRKHFVVCTYESMTSSQDNKGSKPRLAEIFKVNL